MTPTPDASVAVMGSPYYYGGPFDGLQDPRPVPITSVIEVLDTKGVRHRYAFAHAQTPHGRPIYIHETIRRPPWAW